MDYSPELLARARKIRMVLCDVDGVLTNATVTMGGGVETKTFHIRDGLGLRLLQTEAGILVGWISARPSEASTMRANDLKVDFLHQSAVPKVEVAAKLIAENGFEWDQVAYMGDDVVDLGLLKRVGLPAAPADAIPEARALSVFVATNAGGGGAVRELTDLLLKAQGRWEPMIAKFAS
jgi:3-deoxy-D-manno-octulosonate 8-phosphate phosphatase (KDO 8-P phosphatase)